MEFSEITQLVKDGVIDDKPDPSLLGKNIAELIESGFIEERDNEYQFANYLTWEVIYETLLYSDRRYLHDLVAKHIEKTNAENIDNVASKIFYHYDKSENYKKKVFYASISADKASSLYAIDDAIEFYSLAINALDKINIKTNIERSVLNEKIGDTLNISGQYGSAIDAYSKSLDIWMTGKHNQRKLLIPWPIKYASRISSLHHKLAVANEQICDYVSSTKWLDSAEDCLPVKSKSLETKINSTRSAIYYRKGEYSDSIKHANKALLISKKMKSKRDIAYANNMLANSYTATGNYKESIKFLSSAIKIYKHIEDFPGLAITYSNMGNGYGFLGEFDKAVEYYKKALDINIKIQNISSISITRFCLGDISLSRKNIDDAFEHFNFILNTSDKEDIRKDLVGATLYKLAVAHYFDNNKKKCEEYIHKSLRILSDTHSTKFIVEAKLMLAELYYEKKHFDESITVCDEVLTIVKSLNMDIYILNVIKLYADNYEGIGDYKLACVKYDEYLSHVKNLQENYDAALIIIKKASFFDGGLHNKDELINLLNYAINIFTKHSDDKNSKKAKKLLANLVAK